MWILNVDGRWPFNFTKVGCWWEEKHEIDIVALDPVGNNIILGECKYWENEVGVSVLHDLEEKANYVEWQKDSRQVWFSLVSLDLLPN